MRYPFKPFFSRTVGLLGLLSLGWVQVGCAHPVFVEPSVVVHSRIGQLPVHAHMGVPGPVIYAPPPRVIYMPPPPPRVVYVPQVRVLPYGPPAVWRHGHERWQPAFERGHIQREKHGEWRGGQRHRDDERR